MLVLFLSCVVSFVACCFGFLSLGSSLDPIETVRTRLTLSRDLAHIRFKGITDCFVQTVRLEGPRALYKGFGVSMATGAPYVGIQMSIYSWLQHNLPSPTHKGIDVLSKLLSGSAAGVVRVFFFFLLIR